MLVGAGAERCWLIQDCGSQLVEQRLLATLSYTQLHFIDTLYPELISQFDQRTLDTAGTLLGCTILYLVLIWVSVSWSHIFHTYFRIQFMCDKDTEHVSAFTHVWSSSILFTLHHTLIQHHPEIQYPCDTWPSIPTTVLSQLVELLVALVSPQDFI